MGIEATGNTKLQTTEPRAMTVQEKKFHGIKQLISSNMKAMASVLPKHITPERMARIAMTTLQKNPKLIECTPESFLGSLMSCAALGLEPDGTLGQAYLVPFYDGRNKCMVCTFIPGYKGLIKLARQSGDIANIDAHPVRIGDFFEYRFGTDAYLKHVPEECPIIDGEGGKVPDPKWRPGAITHFYAVAKFKDGTSQFNVMKIREVIEIRDNSEGYKASKKFGFPSPWDTHFPAMGMKTAIRQGSKMWPASTDKDNLFQRSVALDEEQDRTGSMDFKSIIDVDLVSMPSEAEEPREEGKRAPVEGSK